MTKKLMAHADVLFLVGMMGILMMMVMPLPAIVLDMLLTFSIAFSLAILLVVLYSKKALDFSVFPSVLLIVTLSRLALNVASTRLILMNGYAGSVIETFGQFVVGGNYIVGLVIFVILVVIQFVVITNGAGRVAEVAARFTLDAMPGKQMSIDADLAAGNMTQEEAKKRRSEIEREADFYGSMDGAGKFVKGDAIASVIIMLVNVLGGLIIGVTQKGLPLLDAVQRYTLLTIGEGLVAQISALLVSTATGLMVTRAASESHLGEDVTRQFILNPLAMRRIVWLLVAFSLIPGLPKLPFWMLAAIFYGLSRKPAEETKALVPVGADGSPAAPDGPEDMVPLLEIEPVELEIGYALLELVDASQGGDLLHRIVAVRRACATELGVVVPPIRIRDNLQLRPGQYRLRLFGQTVGEGECMPRRLLAMAAANPSPIEGMPVKEPVFGLPAYWIQPTLREEAELKGYTVVEPTSVIATHLSELTRAHAYELLGRQEIQQLLEPVRERYPKLVDEVVPTRVGLTELRRVLQNLLKERVSVRDLRTILETLGDFSSPEADAAWLTEKVRESLARTIVAAHVGSERTLSALVLSPRLEAALSEALPGGSGLEPRRVNQVASEILRAATGMANRGQDPVVVCSQRVRPLVRRLTARSLPALGVLSYEEVLPELSLDTVGMVSLDDEG